MLYPRKTAAVAATVIGLASGGGVAWACTGPGGTPPTGTTTTTTTTGTTGTTGTTTTAVTPTTTTGTTSATVRKSHSKRKSHKG